MTGVTKEVAKRREKAAKIKARMEAALGAPIHTLEGLRGISGPTAVDPLTTLVAENPKKAFGTLKPSIHNIPMQPLLAQVAGVMALGAKKYGIKNWRKQPIDASTYYDAIFRHLEQWFEEREDKDIESGKHHLAHIVAGALIVLDAIEHGTLIDDRGRSEVLHPTKD